MGSRTEPAADHSGRGSGLRPCSERLRLAFDLHEAGVDMKRQQLRRRHRQLDAAQVEQLLVAWLRREGEPADAPGVVRTWTDRAP